MENPSSDPATTTEPVEMTLEDYAKAILEAHRNCEAADKESKKKGREAVQWAFKCGQYLNALKESKLIPHGEWLPWLKKNCPEIKPRTAQFHMAAAKNVRRTDLEHFTGVRQYHIATGARPPEQIDKAPETVDGDTDPAIEEPETPETILNKMRLAFENCQSQYELLIKMKPEVEKYIHDTSNPLTPPLGMILTVE